MALLGLLFALALSAAMLYQASAWTLRYRSLQRAGWESGGAAQAVFSASALPVGALARWLYLAGYRKPQAPALFFLSMAAGIGLGGAAAFLMVKTGMVARMARGFFYIPGAAGEALGAIAYAGPVIIFLWCAFAPVSVIRAARRRRVRETERDLPLVMELLSSLAEGGLSFDAALARILAAYRTDRPFFHELRIFQGELLLGFPRVHCFRRLADRIGLPAVSILISALVQAEQVGAGMAETLRHQAEEIRNQRRERVLLLAQTLPVKMVFPLVICFLPGIFLSTLGPILFQAINLLKNSVIRGLN